MKIFISWSGERSRIIAEGLRKWLPKVIQAVKLFYSPNIEKGTKSIDEINTTLKSINFGILCLNPDNLDNIWIHYEAGALSKIEEARIWTLLDGLSPSDVRQPLAQFQHTLTKKEDIYELLKSINKHLPEPLDLEVLQESFDRWWPDLEKTIKEAEKTSKSDSEKNGKSDSLRTNREVLDEILELLRNQERKSGVKAHMGGSLPIKDTPGTRLFSRIPIFIFTDDISENKTADVIHDIDRNIHEYFDREITDLDRRDSTDAFYFDIELKTPINRESITDFTTWLNKKTGVLIFTNNLTPD